MTSESLPKAQWDTLNTRSVLKFGTNLKEGMNKKISFNQMDIGGVYPITIHYFQGFVPENPTVFDSRRAIGGGYPQPCKLVSAVKVICKVADTSIFVEFEKPVLIHYCSGPRHPIDFCVLDTDGEVRYVDDGINILQWGGYKPKWEHTVFPILPEVVRGI